jgi:hypothetical protein
MEKPERYNYYKDLHPDWSDEQIWTAVSIDMQNANTLSKGGEDVKISPEIINQILQKAQEWLSEVLPVVFEKVKEFFQIALRKIAELAARGLEYITELIAAWKAR